jgi:hypothetical protein
MIGVYGITVATVYHCPSLKTNKWAVGEMVYAAGIRTSAEFDAPSMQTKLKQASLVAGAIYETLDAEGKELLCKRVYGWYGPSGTVEPRLLELR